MATTTAEEIKRQPPSMLRRIINSTREHEIERVERAFLALDRDQQSELRQRLFFGRDAKLRENDHDLRTRRD